MCSRNGSNHKNVIDIPDLDMTNAEDCQSMFYSAGLRRFPLKNTGKVTTFRSAFYGGKFAEAELDCTSCTDMRGAFNNCTLLETLTLRNTQNVSSWEVCFAKCSALKNLSVDALKIVDHKLDFSACENLTIESLINIVNALLDNTGVYDKNSDPYSIKLGSDNITALKNRGIEDHQDELYYISIATNKNINLV
jgi:hypothetical protein